MYTIYESIGKSVVVPHCGSKTINVRLTVSPDAKSKSKSGDSSHSVKKTSRKQRLKTRRLFKCEDDEEGSGSGCFDPTQDQTKITQVDENVQQTSVLRTQSPSVGIEKIDVTEKIERPSKDQVDGRLAPCCEPIKGHRLTKTVQAVENIYESAPMVSNENTTPQTKTKCDKVTLNNNNSCCQDCRVTNQLYQDNVTISKPCARRIGRKSRSRKQKNAQDAHPAARIRSLSVGNENSFRNNGDASSGASGKDRNDECLNNLRRNDLIDIIRESMEKSRLCFQTNG